MPQSSSAAKRPRQEPDDNRAECPFSIRLVDPKDKDLKAKSKKRRKRAHNAAGNDDDDVSRKVLQQCAPFEPRGTFETYDTMDVHYVVEPAKQWADMTRYNSFVLNGIKYYCEGFIYVANEATIERQKSNAGNREGRKRSEDDWVARILEIRASDEHHVYARVFWMYWPDELPYGSHYRKKQVQGRQPYHGFGELIASNHMDIINVVSVTSKATVNHLIEDKDDDVQSALYWRQALDVRNCELSTIEVVCDCNQPANPDKMLVGCGNKDCGKWIHEECLKHYALMRVFDRLGTDKPHVSETRKIEPPPKEEVKEPLSPKESGGAVSAQHSIDVKADTVEVGGAVDREEEEEATNPKSNGATTVDSTAVPTTASTNGNDVPEAAANGTREPKEIALRDKNGAAAGGASSVGAASEAAAGSDASKREVTPAWVNGVTSTGVATSDTGVPSVATPVPATARSTSTSAAATTPKRAGGRSKRRHYPTLHSFDNKKKPYDGLFEASLLLDPAAESGPTMIEIRDARPGVTGGDKVWQEPAECPLCGSAIR